MRKILSVILAALLLVTVLCGCELSKGNAGSQPPQVEPLTQKKLLGTWNMRFSYSAFFRNLNATPDAADWVTLMTNVTTKAKFDMTFFFTADGNCTTKADPEAVTMATEQFMADLQAYLYADGIYDLYYMRNSWGKAVVDKKLQEKGVTLQEEADQLIAELLPLLEAQFADMAKETTVQFELKGNLLRLYVGGVTLSTMYCTLDGNRVVFQQDNPMDISYYADMALTRVEE